MIKKKRNCQGYGVLVGIVPFYVCEFVIGLRSAIVLKIDFG